MPYDPEKHHRRSIRLRGFDYRTPGLYVVTICVEHRLHLFGQINDREMHPSPAGAMVQQTWDEIPSAYPGVDIDAFVVMPNHVHGIVFLVPNQADLYPSFGNDPVGAIPRGCPGGGHDGSGSPQDSGSDDPRKSVPGSQHASIEPGQPQGVAPTGGVARLSLPEVVHRFKTLTTKCYSDGVKEQGWTPYDGRLWQRNYYERVVRSGRELDKFRRYIEANPARWFEDPYNPS